MDRYLKKRSAEEEPSTADDSATKVTPSKKPKLALPPVLFVFAHGAGASSSSEWMKMWAKRLRALGASVFLFDYEYMKSGKKAPDRHPKLVQTHAAAIAEAQKEYPNLPTFLIGKSMGSRMGLHVTVEAQIDDSVKGCICMGYPLVGINGAVREDILLQLTKPVLFVSGTRDKLCPLDMLKKVQPKMKGPNRLFVVENGDHSLDLLKGYIMTSGVSQEKSNDNVQDAIVAFVNDVLAGTV